MNIKHGICTLFTIHKTVSLSESTKCRLLIPQLYGPTLVESGDKLNGNSLKHFY